MEDFKGKHIDSVFLEHGYSSGFETHQGLEPTKKRENTKRKEGNTKEYFDQD